MNFLQRVGFAILKAGVTRFPDYFPYIVQDPWPGAWQKNQEWREPTVLAHQTVFACVTLIADDVAKMRMRLMERDDDGILTELALSPFLIPLQEPNNYQTQIQFFQHWMYSKLLRGNTYVLKSRDGRGMVNGLDILNPDKVKPLETTDGEILYQLNRDTLANVPSENITLPASEIIHDRTNCLFHPMIGVPPIFASRDLARQALRILRYSDRFFENAARPSGFLTAPGLIPPETANRLKAEWTQEYSGPNQGRVAVAGNGLKWEPFSQNAVDSQLVEQLQLNAKSICTAYRVPSYKVGASEPNYSGNIAVQDTEYYKNTIQHHATEIESLLNKGLELPRGFVTKFDVDDLLRMDLQSLITMLAAAMKDGIMASNEARKILNMKPKKGGEDPMAQQQMFTLAALAERSNAPPLPAAPSASGAGTSAAPTSPGAIAEATAAKQFEIALDEIRRGLHV